MGVWVLLIFLFQTAKPIDRRKVKVLTLCQALKKINKWWWWWWWLSVNIVSCTAMRMVPWNLSPCYLGITLARESLTCTLWPFYYKIFLMAAPWEATLWELVAWMWHRHKRQLCTRGGCIEAAQPDHERRWGLGGWQPPMAFHGSCQ